MHYAHIPIKKCTAIVDREALSWLEGDKSIKEDTIEEQIIFP